MNKLIEGVNFVPAFLPVDTDADQTGDYVSLKNYNKVGVLFIKAAGSATDDPTLTLYESTDVAGAGTVQALTAIDTHWIKQAATNLTAVGTFTKTTQTLASTIVFNATSGEQAIVDYFEVDAAQLSDGFDCIRVDVANAASAGSQYATLMYIMLEPRYGEAAALSAIID